MEWRILYKPKWEAMTSSSGCVGKGSRWTQGQRWRQRRAGPHKYRRSQKVPENIKCAWRSLTQFKPAHVIIPLWHPVAFRGLLANGKLIATTLWSSLIALAALCFACLVRWMTHWDLWYCGWATAGVQTKAATTQKGDVLQRAWCSHPAIQLTNCSRGLLVELKTNHAWIAYWEKG